MIILLDHVYKMDDNTEALVVRITPRMVTYLQAKDDGRFDPQHEVVVSPSTFSKTSLKDLGPVDPERLF